MTKKISDLLESLSKEKAINQLYSNRINTSPLNENWVIQSKKMLEVLRLAMQVAPYNTSVMITGEPGTGKEAICNLIHNTSKRSSFPLIKTNCSLLTNDQFIHAFTGDETKYGFIELANGGTLLIDEIAELSPKLQKYLLKILSTDKIIKRDTKEEVDMDIRLITTTNKDIVSLVESGDFDRELYERLNVTHITVPPLKERQEDIEPLANFFLNDFCKSYGLKFKFSKETLYCFKNHDWPGNIRELINLIENLVVSTSTSEIGVHLLPYHMLEKTPYLPNKTELDYLDTDMTYTEIINDIETQLIKQAVVKYGSIRKAAKALQISHSTLSRRISK
jgi:DNA-binding NtrC family response regulator